jgi:alpha-ketoglutarate-dependent taurine dioxygenase
MIGAVAFRQLQSEGYVDLGQTYKNQSTFDVAVKIGTPIRIPGISEVQKLSPKLKHESPSNTYSGNYGTYEFPPHTDLANWHRPPRYFILRCISPDPGVATVFLSFDKALKGLTRSIRERALFKPRRRIERKMFFLRFSEDDLFRWDPLYIVPENSEAHTIGKHIQSLDKSKFDKVNLSYKSQTILVDNWRVLHGRSEITTPTSSRCIERVYLSEINI